LWLATGSPAVLIVLEAEDPMPITEIKSAWNDVMNVTVSSAMTPEEGLQLGAKSLENWHQEQALLPDLRSMSH
jgi:hypothetical protein